MKNAWPAGAQVVGDKGTPCDKERANIFNLITRGGSLKLVCVGGKSRWKGPATLSRLRDASFAPPWGRGPGNYYGQGRDFWYVPGTVEFKERLNVFLAVLG
ncbi:hypothetical protein KM043_010213 [Ampulex compressa]|nr:hypothetical protein KM043_010213 [Ampulex compressa]